MVVGLRISERLNMEKLRLLNKLTFPLEVLYLYLLHIHERKHLQNLKNYFYFVENLLLFSFFCSHSFFVISSFPPTIAEIIAETD